MPGLGWSGTSRISFFRSFIRTSPLLSIHSNSLRSSAGIDHESALILRIRSRGFFLNFADVGETWSALQQGTKLRVLLRRTHGKYFHAAVTEISDETVNAQLLGGSLRVITKAHALDHSRHEVPLG